MRSQATKLDVIQAQKERRRNRMWLALSFIVIPAMGALITYALIGFITPLPA